MTSSFLRSLTDTRLDDALLGAAAGRPLIMRVRRPGTAEQLLERAAAGPAMFNTVLVEAGVGRSPQQALVEAVQSMAPAAIDLSGICSSSQLSYTLLAVDIRETDPSPWLMLAGIFASQRAQAVEGPALLLITDNVAVPAGCDILDDGTFVGPAEAAVFVSESRHARSLIAECGDAAAIEVSRGDLTQLRALLDLDDRDRFNPIAWVRAQPIDDSKLLWRGKEEVCSTWLAAHNPKRLRHRIWRGQISVLFPWLAEALSAFLETHRHKLPGNLIDPWTEAVVPPDEFEWSNILYVLNQRRVPQADCAFRLRKLRNALAHQEPLSWVEASSAEADLKFLMTWR